MTQLYTNYEKIWKAFNPSKNLNSIISEIKPYLKNYNYNIDKYNNIFIGDFSEKKPCLVSHLDSVHTKKSKKFYLKNNILYSNKGIGGDDKCGIIAILEILKTNKNVNAILTSDEEIGGIGASKISNMQLKNVQYFIEIDRMGNNDIIFESGMNKIASEELQIDLMPIMKKFKYKENYGCFTDVNILTEISKKSAINISCGYFNPHTIYEYVDLKGLQNCINFVKEILLNIKKEYTWKEYIFNDSQLEIYDDTLETLITNAYLSGADDKIINWIIQAYKLGAKEKVIDNEIS